MYRTIVIVSGALALAACASSPDWLKPATVVDNVRFESEPPNAEAKVSNGQTCRTPCALALPTEAPLTVTFTLTGFQPESETLEVIAEPGTVPRLRPNPVTVELTPAPPPPATKRPAKKSAPKRPAAAAPAPARAAAPAPAPAPMAPVQQQPAPWPAPPAQR